MDEDFKGVGSDRFVGSLSPAATHVDGIARVAADQQRVEFVGQVQDFGEVERQDVVAAAGQVDVLDTQQAVVGQSRQVQRQTAAVQTERVGTVAADDA